MTAEVEEAVKKIISMIDKESTRLEEAATWREDPDWSFMIGGADALHNLKVDIESTFGIPGDVGNG